MPRKNSLNKRKNLLEIINEEIFMNEIFNQEIKTEYQIIEYSGYIIFRFKTNSNTFYDLEFHDSEEEDDTEFESGKTLLDYSLKSDGKYVKCFDIAFTITETIDKDNPHEYEKETNKNEYLELFGRITYILKKEYKKRNNIDLFIIGYARRNKNDIYMKIVENNFSNEFHIEKGYSIHHRGGKSMFLIRK